VLRFGGLRFESQPAKRLERLAGWVGRGGPEALGWHHIEMRQAM
jgi:hypothetical protein